MAQTTSSRLEARVSPEIHALLKRAAEIEGRSLTDFVVAAASAAARAALETEQIIRLSADDQRAFVENLINPPAPSAALARAQANHARLIGQ